MDSSGSKMELIEALADDFAARQRRGEKPLMEDYIARHPELAGEIREVFPALLMMQQVAPAGDDLKEAEKTPQGPLRRVGEYRILRELGRGGMGVVYEAEQESLQRRVALKILPRELAISPNALDRFKREARAAARMHHTNIVPVFEVGRDGDTVFYTMQLIHGQGLNSVIGDLKQLRDAREIRTSREHISADSAPAKSIAVSLMRGELQPEDLAEALEKTSSKTAASRLRYDPAFTETAHHSKLQKRPSVSLPGDSEISTADSNHRRFHRSVGRIGVQIAEALSYAHARGIIHRDIKPSNLILDAGGVVWITDFGLAKVDDEGMTHTGDILGTMRYMSPERFRGECDVRADVYSLGLTLYELLLLKPAFDSPDRLKLIELVRQSEPPTPRGVDPRIPRDLETIVLKSIDKDPKRRYQSADELSDDLRRFVDDQPIRARRVSPAERLIRWSRRNKSVAAFLAAIASLLIASAVGSSIAFKVQRDLASNNLRLANDNLRLAIEKEDARAKAVAAEQHQASLRAAAELNQYVSDIGLAYRILDEGNLVGAEELLQKYIPAKSDDRDLRGFEWDLLWRRCQGDALYSFPTQNYEIQSLAISPGGDWIATTSIEQTGRPKSEELTGELVLYQTKSRQRRFLRQGGNPAQCAAFSPDNKTLITGNLDGSLDLWTGEGFRERQRLVSGHEGSVLAIAFSPTKEMIATGGEDGRFILRSYTQLTEIYRSVRLGTHRTNFPSVRALAFSRDGRTLAAAGSSAAITWIDVADKTSQEKEIVSRNSSYVNGLAFSPSEDQLLAFATEDNWVRLLDIRTGEMVDVGRHDAPVNSVAFSDGGKTLVSAGRDHTIRLWDRRLTRQLGILKGHRGIVRQALPSLDGRIYSVSSDKSLAVWSTDPPSTSDVLKTDSIDWVLNPHFSADGQLLLTGSFDGAVRIWNVDSQIVVDTLPAFTHYEPDDDKYMIGMAFHPKKEILAVGNNSGEIKIWDLRTRQMRTSFQAHKPPGELQRLHFSPDGAHLVSTMRRGKGAGGVNPGPGEMSIWDCATLEHGAVPMAKTVALKEAVLSATFTPDSRILITTARDGVALWDVESCHKIKTLTDKPAMSATVSRDGRLLATCNDGRLLVTGGQLWDLSDLESGEPIRELPDIEGQRIVFAPDNRTLVTSRQSRAIGLWNVETGRELMSLEGHTGFILGITFSPEGTILATASSDGSVRLWRGFRGKK